MSGYTIEEEAGYFYVFHHGHKVSSGFSSRSAAESHMKELQDEDEDSDDEEQIATP